MFAFDFQLVGKTSFFIYFCGFMTPIAISILMRFVGRKVDPIKTISIYGYSWFIYIVCAVISIYPNEVRLLRSGLIFQKLQWSALLYAGLTSIFHLLICFNKEIREQSEGRAMWSIVAFLVLTQILIVVLLKVMFFKEVKIPSSAKK